MGYYVKIKDLLDNQEVIVGKTEEWNASLEGQGVLVNMYVGMKDAFKGKSADAAREYLSEVHSVVISSYIQMLNEVRVRVLDYVSGYTSNIESSETGKIRQESLEGELESIRSEETEFGCIDERIKTTIASVSHIVSISYPNGENIRDNYYNMQTLLSKLNEDILAYEESHVYDLERVKYILEQININVNSHKELKIDQESQKKLFVAQIDSQYYIQQCAEITGEQYGAFCYVREVERRKEEGVKGMFTGAFAIVIGVTAIVVTFGASAPVVAPAVALALGSTASIYGGSELYTGLETATYGYTGDAETVIYNPVRDTCFKGYEDWYYGIGELSVLGCSAIVMGGGAVSASAKYGTSVWYEAGKETTAIIAGAGADYLTRQGVSKLTDDPLTIYGTGVIVGGIAAGGTDAIGNRLRPNFVATKPNEVGLVGNNGSVTEIPKQDTASIVNPAKNIENAGEGSDLSNVNGEEVFGPYYDEAVRLYKENPDYFPNPDLCTIVQGDELAAMRSQYDSMAASGQLERGHHVQGLAFGGENVQSNIIYTGESTVQRSKLTLDLQQEYYNLGYTSNADYKVAKIVENPNGNISINGQTYSFGLNQNHTEATNFQNKVLRWQRESGLRY